MFKCFKKKSPPTCYLAADLSSSHRRLRPWVQVGVRSPYTQPGEADPQLWPSSEHRCHGVSQDFWRALLVKSHLNTPWLTLIILIVALRLAQETSWKTTNVHYGNVWGNSVSAHRGTGDCGQHYVAWSFRDFYLWGQKHYTQRSETPLHAVSSEPQQLTLGMSDSDADIL